MTTAHKEKLYHLVGPYMKFSLMKDKMKQIMPFRNPREQRFTQLTLQQTDLGK